MSNKEFVINVILTLSISILFILFRTWDLKVITIVSWIFFTMSNTRKMLSLLNFKNKEYSSEMIKSKS